MENKVNTYLIFYFKKQKKKVDIKSMKVLGVPVINTRNHRGCKFLAEWVDF